jgi:carbonic anhydrase
MNELIGRVFAFEKTVFPNQSDLFSRLVRHGQSPKALMISCADSRIVPEQIMQAAPGELFVCRNAGNIVPPYSQANGGVTSTVEYAVMALGVRDIIVCGHSDCGAMKAVSKPEAMAGMPNVAAWLRHANAAECVVTSGYPDLDPAARVHAIALENIVVQIAHLRTHPAVAAGIARGDISLHGWFVDIHAGQVLGLDGETGRFVALREDKPLPVALASGQRFAADIAWPEAAE